MTSARAGVLSIGTELMRGEIVDTNSAWLADALTELGLVLGRMESVGDEQGDIVRALERLASEHALVVCTGGLGPTTDDLTANAVAAWLGVPLETHPPSLERLREQLARRGRALTPSSKKQADFPRGARVLDNPHGTAPGFAVSRGGTELFFMPGVPREMKPMFARYVPPVAERMNDGAQHQVRLRCFGLPESVANDRLQGLDAAHPVRVAYRAHFPEIEVKLFARVPLAAHPSRAAAEAEARRITRAAADDARARLGAAVYGEGEPDLPAVVVEALRARGLSLALAESCTGGLVSALVAAQPVSDVLVGGVVAYDNAVKTALLGVGTELLEAHGAVSAPVAEAMARGVRERLGASFGVSLTGIAGPSGGSEQKPVGLVHFAVAGEHGVTAREIVVQRPRRDVQLYASWAALALLREAVERHPTR